MYLNKNIIWKRTDTGSKLYNIVNGSEILLNDTSTQIFLLSFVNRVLPESVAATISSKVNDVSYDDILNDVNKFINDLKQTDFITENEEEMSYVNLLSPKQVIDNAIFEVTKRCNLNCIHCMEGGSSNTDELSLKEIETVIDNLRMLGVYRLVITGGEPFIRDDITSILKKANESYMKTIVFTNGLLLTDEIINEIKDYNIILRFSIDGATAETHDKIRGIGNFDKTIEVMKKCAANGIDIAIASTITSLNFDQYMDIVKLAESLNVCELELSEVNALGNAKDNEYLMLSEEQLSQMRVYNLRLAHKCKSFRKGMGFERQHEQALYEKERKSACNAGISMCFICANGDVYPCTLFKNFEEFKAGNVKEDRLYNIWRESEAFNKLRNLNINDIESCKGCECFKLCPGGCRAKAYMKSGDLLGPSDPLTCSISKKYLAKLVAGELNYVWE